MQTRLSFADSLAAFLWYGRPLHFLYAFFIAFHPDSLNGYGIFIWLYFTAKLKGISFGEHCAKVQNDGGIVDPEQQKDNGTGCSVSTTRMTVTNVKRNCKPAEHKQSRGKNCSPCNVSPGGGLFFLSIRISNPLDYTEAAGF